MKRLIESEPGSDGGGGTFTPQEPGQPPASPVPVTPPPPAATPTAVTPPYVIPLPTPREAPTALPVPLVPGVPRYSASDYAAAARSLMPRGRAWPTDPDSVQAKVLAAIGATLERLDASLNVILVGSVPGQLTPLLPEWEASLGLPDPCAGAAPTLDQRLEQVRGRFVGAGGQSKRHFIDFAAALGFDIEIEVYAPFRARRSAAGDAVDSVDCFFRWGVRILHIRGSLPADVLMCELEALKPAESTVLLLH